MRRPVSARVVFPMLLLAVLGGCVSLVDRQELAEEYFNLGNAYFELQDYDRSYRYYRRAIELSEAIPAAGFNLARLYLERGEDRNALDVLTALLAQDPDNTLIREVQGYTLYRLGEISRARQVYGGLLAESLSRSRIAYNLALLEVMEGDYAAAAAVLTEHLGAAEEDREFRWLLAEALFHTGQEKEALEELARYRRLADGSARDMGRLFQRYVEWSFFLDALELLDDLPSQALNDPDVAWAEAWAYLAGTDDFERGLQALERSLQGRLPDEEEEMLLLEVLAEEEQDILREIFAERRERARAEEEGVGPDQDERDQDEEGGSDMESEAEGASRDAGP